MSEISNLLKQDSTELHLTVNNLTLRESPGRQPIPLDRQCDRSLFRAETFEYSLGNLKLFAIKGMNMNEEIFNKLLIDSIEKLQKGLPVGDFVNRLFDERNR